MAKELAAKSVRARRGRAQAAREAAEIKVPKDSGELVTELAKVFADVKCGELDVAIARAMASVATVVLKGWEQTAIREELRRLLEMINERNSAREGGLATNVLSKESNND